MYSVRCEWSMLDARVNKDHVTLGARTKFLTPPEYRGGGGVVQVEGEASIVVTEVDLHLGLTT